LRRTDGEFFAQHAELIHVLLGAAVTAIVVALMEELIFRGALFGILRKTLVWPAALAVSSAVYAAVHFLQKPPAAPPTVDWLSGIRLLPELFRLPADGSGLAPAFFTLLLAGAILALAYQRTGTLFMSIGLHAGWIFWLTAYRSLTREAPGAARWIWGGDKLIDGWLPFFILALVLAGCVARPGSGGGRDFPAENMTAAISSWWSTALDAALNLFYPPVCQICGEERAAAAEGYAGPKCRGGVRFVKRRFASGAGCLSTGQ
jgi:membrane protease YdiL (CAAX protease family)